MKIRYLPKAIAQLDAILTTIATENPKAATKVAARFKRAVTRLAAFPYSSRATNHPNVRVLPLLRYPYLLFYEIDAAKQEIRILRVRHMAQDPKRHLE